MSYVQQPQPEDNFWQADPNDAGGPGIPNPQRKSINAANQDAGNVYLNGGRNMAEA